jgi:hypothetical protein
MRKAHFGAVYGAIARALEDSEDVMVLRVEDDALGGSLISHGVSVLFSSRNTSSGVL